jgi:hypothetical protein
MDSQYENSTTASPPPLNQPDFTMNRQQEISAHESYDDELLDQVPALVEDSGATLLAHDAIDGNNFEQSNDRHTNANGVAEYATELHFFPNVRVALDKMKASLLSQSH